MMWGGWTCRNSGAPTHACACSSQRGPRCQRCRSCGWVGGWVGGAVWGSLGQPACPSGRSWIETCREQLSLPAGSAWLSALAITANQLPACLCLQDSLAGHLPAAGQPAEVGALLDRVQRQLEARWRVTLPPAAPLQAAAAAPQAAPPAGVQLQAPPAEPKQEMEQQQQHGQQGSLPDLGGGSLPAAADPAAVQGGGIWPGAAAGFTMQ